MAGQDASCVSPDRSSTVLTDRSSTVLTDQPNPLRTIAADKEVALVIRTIKEQYGFVVTTAYARDLIAFVDEVTADVARE